MSDRIQGATLFHGVTLIISLVAFLLSLYNVHQAMQRDPALQQALQELTQMRQELVAIQASQLHITQQLQAILTLP